MKIGNMFPFKAFCCTAILLLGSSAAAPVKRDATSLSEKFTCLHKSEAKNRDWKTCSNQGDGVLDLLQMQIPEAILNDHISALNVPQNSFKCFRTSTYSYNSPTKCPAFCRLRDMKESEECKVGGILNTNHIEEHGIAVVKSPRYDCSENYYRNEICVYNISMACKENSHVIISNDHSNVDLGDGDFLQIFNPKNRNHKYPKISGNSLTHSQHNIPMMDFLMIFTSNDDSKQGKGFSIQLECPSIQETSLEEDNEEEMSESGDGSGDNLSKY